MKPGAVYLRDGDHVDRQRAGQRLRAELEAEPEEPARVACRPPLSPAQRCVAAQLSCGLTHQEIADRFQCKRSTVRFFIEEGARRIPGNLSASHKLINWYRGAPRETFGPDPE